MSNIHEYICTSAKNKQVAMVILPYHKQQRLDGSLETTRADYGGVNQRVLEHAPCSVGILVDRGFGGNTHVSARRNPVLFYYNCFGGQDDREALSNGARMSEHPGINLIVVRFILDLVAAEDIVRIDVENKDDPADSLLGEFQQKNLKNESVRYEERVIRNGEEIISMLREFSQCNLLLVGLNPEGWVGSVLNGSTSSPDLGPVGSLLVINLTRISNSSLGFGRATTS
ncbi:hypothetical protein ACHQM5_004325 [Ranunculus cassubicifolius]